MRGVGNIFSKDVRAAFAKYGNITEFTYNNRKGKAIITYEKDYMAQKAIQDSTLKNPFINCSTFSVSWFETKEQATKDFVDLENTETAYTFQALLLYMQMMGLGAAPGGAPGAGGAIPGMPPGGAMGPMGGMPPHMV